MDFISLHLGQAQSPDVYEQWLDTVANKGIKRLYYNVVQTGSKEGTRYATHAIDVVSLAASLRPIFEMSELEQRILFTALSVHDINKSPTHAGKMQSFGKLATEDNIRQELEAVGFDEFFPEWQDNLVAVKYIVAGHGGKFHAGLSRVIPKAKQAENIPRERLEALVTITKGVDAIALAQRFSDKQHLEKGLTELNAVLPQQYELAWHRISEQRGILTNVIHLMTAKFLQEHGWHMLTIFPEGTYYMKPVGSVLPEDASYRIARSVVQRLKALSAKKFEDFIQAKPLGISIDAQVLDMAVPMHKIWERVDAIIESRKQRDGFKIRTDNTDGQEDKCRQRLKKVASNENEEHQKLAREWLRQADLFPQTQAGMARGELLRTYYIFLETHFKPYFKSGKIDPWTYLYDLVGIPEVERERFEVFDKRQDRAYVVAKYYINDAEAILERIEEDAEQFLANDTPGEIKITSSPIADYVLETLSLSHQLPDQSTFLANLQQYVDNSSVACAYGSSANETLTWMSVDVPKGIKVQQFSNRLPAGKRDPKRNVSPVVHAQFQLENLGYASSDQKALYLHCMPYTFLTAPFLKALRLSLDSANKQGVAAGMLQVDEVLEKLKTEDTFNLISLKPTKGNGLPIPVFSEELVGNVITLPLNSLGNDSVRFLEAIPYAFLLSRFFGVKVLLTESAIPMLTKDEIGDVYLDGIPALFRGLFRSENLTPDDNGIIPEWEMYQQLREAARSLYVAGSKRNALLELISAYLAGDLHVYHVADRLIEAKARSVSNSDAAATRISQKILPLLESVNILGGKRDRIRSA